jgi:hypothetical protein
LKIALSSIAGSVDQFGANLEVLFLSILKDQKMFVAKLAKNQ